VVKAWGEGMSAPRLEEEEVEEEEEEGERVPDPVDRCTIHR